jgi:hypothetical protein
VFQQKHAPPRAGWQILFENVSFDKLRSHQRLCYSFVVIFGTHLGDDKVPAFLPQLNMTFPRSEALNQTTFSASCLYVALLQYRASVPAQYPTKDFPEPGIPAKPITSLSALTLTYPFFGSY